MSVLDTLRVEAPLLADAIIWLQNANHKFNYYGFFATYFKFIKDENMEAPAGVTLKKDAFYFYYNPKLMGANSKIIKNVDDAIFVVIHECNHIILNHIQRQGMRNPRLSNIAMDMIINSDLQKNNEKYIDGLWYLPKEYTGEIMYEYLYEWLIDQMDKEEGERTFDIGSGSLLDDHDKMGESDELDSKLGEQIVREIHSRLKSRGLTLSDCIEGNMNWTKKKSKVNLFKQVFGHGTMFEKSYKKENRRHPDLKAKIRKNRRINVILDTSGSLYNDLDKYVANVIGNYETRIIQCDTEVCYDRVISTMSEWKKIPKKGGGGTVLMPAINKLIAERDFCPLYLITDGCTDTLDFTRYKESVVIVTTGEAPPFIGNPKIIIDHDHD